MKKVVLLSTVSLLAASAATADEVGRWYLTPQLGALITDDDRNLEDSDLLYGVSVGKHLNERWSMELNLNHSNLDGLEPLAASLDALRVFRREEPFSPYLTFGAGAMRNDYPTDRNTDVIAQAGVGVLWRLGSADSPRSFSLRPEIKARWADAAGPDYVDAIATLGFQFGFGAATTRPAPVRETAPPRQPAPPPQPEPEPEPREPADSDRDGVPDSSDRCPDTRRGVAVDGRGCAQRGEVALTDVTFETNSAELTGTSSSRLDRLAAELRKYPRLQIELQGHTDSSGAEDYNLRLSQQRADAVRDYLLRRGASPSQVVARGYGESQPLADNSTAAGRAENRRVVMLVLQNPGDVEIKRNE